jgi:tRNA pseudouridine13 synthase
MSAAKIRALFKQSPEDFRVNEIPAYLPSGEGEHVYVHLEKRGVATDVLVRMVAERLGLRARDIGVAGMKDRHAVSRQWLSIPVPHMRVSIDSEAEHLTLEGVTVLDVKRHGNKLRTGHLRGNRFEIILRDVDASARAEIVSAFERIRICGVPNAYGAQRFGKNGDNAEFCAKFLRGEVQGPRDPQKRRFFFSALQSKIFNAVLAARLADGTWNVPQRGDLLARERKALDTDERGGALFLCEDLPAEEARAIAGEVSPTGPMPGLEMRKPGPTIERFETSIIDEVLGPSFPWEDTRALGEGTRRPLRVWVEALTVSIDALLGDLMTVKLAFVLTKGAYATTVLQEVFELVEPERDTDTQSRE